MQRLRFDGFAGVHGCKLIGARNALIHELLTNLGGIERIRPCGCIPHCIRLEVLRAVLLPRRTPLHEMVRYWLPGIGRVWSATLDMKRQGSGSHLLEVSQATGLREGLLSALKLGGLDNHVQDHVLKGSLH